MHLSRAVLEGPDEIPEKGRNFTRHFLPLFGGLPHREKRRASVACVSAEVAATNSRTKGLAFVCFLDSRQGIVT